MDDKKQSFEESLNELEALVAQMEAGQMGLEEMVLGLEKGQKLIKACNQRLDEVERRIEVIKKNPDGSVETSPLPPMA